MAASPTKYDHELRYWQTRYKKERQRLSNSHYRYFYTELFGLGLDDYTGARVMDIGCGPRGSLEWAVNAAERVGLDPLADEYLKLGAASHQMTYVAAPSERMPFPDGSFDVVCTFNSLDHVDDLDRTIAEIKRITRPGGTLLMIVEIDHPPTRTEPLSLSRDVVDLFAPEFITVRRLEYDMPGHTRGIYVSIQDANPAIEGKPAALCARLQRV
jgi:ubiquinone/menaquinone biosynthesis C-methylase UbiE